MEPQVLEPSGTHDPATGRFLPGHGATKPVGAKAKRTREGEAFARAWLDENAKAILDAITTDGDLDQKWRALAFFYEHANGRPMQRIEFDLRSEAALFAEQAGVDPQEVLAVAERIVAGAIPN